MAAKPKPLREVKLGTLMPGFLILGILLNLAITRPPEIRLDGFAPVTIRAEFQPSYQQDLDGGTFPAVDPEIMDDARETKFVPAAPSEGGETPASTPTASSTPSSSGSGLVPTVVSIVPTLVPPIVPTVVSIVPTLVPPVVPTAVSIVPTVVSDTVDTVKTLVSPLDLLP